jgi:hypothetical protein
LVEDEISDLADSHSSIGGRITSVSYVYMKLTEINVNSELYLSLLLLRLKLKLERCTRVNQKVKAILRQQL